MSVSVGGIQSDGQNVKNDINPRLSREVNNPCTPRLASELWEYSEYSGRASCSCKEWWVYTDRPPVSKISLSKTATACQLHEENRLIGEAKSDTFWKFLRDNSDAQ